MKRIVLEVAADEFQSGDQKAMTNLEVIIRGMVHDAAKGDKVAREVVVERLEGKAVRAAQVSPPDTTLEEQIDRIEVAALNTLVPEGNK